MSNTTRSESIKTLKEHLSHWERLLQEHICEEQEGIDTISALKLAISSLETDEAYQLEYESTTKSETLISLDVYKQVAWERDIAIQQLHELGYEFGQKIEPTTKNDLGVDAISRRSIIEEMEKRYAEGDYITKGFINSLPSVTPQEPVIDKIRAEITNIPITDSDGHFNNWYREPQAIINDVLQIIDKYKAETENP